MEVVNFSDRHELNLWATRNFFEIAHKAIEERGIFDVAFSGGTTAQSFFKALFDRNLPPELIASTRFFVSDERVVSLSSNDSNAGNLWRILLLPLSVSRQCFFPMYDGTQGPEVSARTYEHNLKVLLPLSEDNIPIFDLIYLGIGENGHTASIFPHSLLMADIDQNENLVAASGEVLENFERITFMPKLILSARNICVMAPGAQKIKVIDEILHGPINTKEYPAQLILRSKHPSMTLLTGT